MAIFNVKKYKRPEGISSIRELFPIDFTTLNEFLKMEDPQVTIGFNTRLV